MMHDDASMARSDKESRLNYHWHWWSELFLDVKRFTSTSPLLDRFWSLVLKLIYLLIYSCSPHVTTAFYSGQVSGFWLTKKEATTVLCSVVKHAGSGRARKKCRGKHETKSSDFPHFLGALPLHKCLQQNRAQSRLLYLFHDKSDNFPTHSAEFSKQTLFSKRVKVASAVYCSLIKHAKQANHNHC